MVVSFYAVLGAAAAAFVVGGGYGIAPHSSERRI